MNAATEQPRPKLAIIESATTHCALGGKPILRGAEAWRFYRTCFMHLGCADTCAGPRGS